MFGGIKYIIGVDPAVRNTGVSVFDNVGTLLLKHNIKTKSGTPDHVAVDMIVEEFFEILAPYLTPQLLARRGTAFFIEHVKYTRQSDKSALRGEVVGAIKWNIRQEGWNIWGVDPGALNSFLDGRFNIPAPSRKRKSDAQKKHTRDVLHRHCNFYTNDNDIADAYVAGLFGFAYLVEKQRLTCTPLCKVKF